MASCTEPTVASPDSSTTILAATTGDTGVPAGSQPAECRPIATPVATAAATTCWNSSGSRQPLSTRPIRSISAVVIAEIRATSGPAPISTAKPPAMTAQPAVATHRG